MGSLQRENYTLISDERETLVGDEQFIVALDVGTTSIRCHVYDATATLRGSAQEQVTLLCPHPGWFEIEPEPLWDSFVRVIKDAIANAGLLPTQVTCIGISTQRSSFITWDKVTGETFHNFITWKDVRADKLIKEWNNSFTMKCIRTGASCLYMLSRQKRFLSGSVLKLLNNQVLMRLVWALENVEKLKRRVAEEKALFGTLDTWLMYRLTGGSLHVTDYSNVSVTAFFDPFILDWGDWALKVFGIPRSILPEVTDSSGNLGSTVPELFGTSIPIRCLIGDVGASLFGSCCFNVGDVKFTMGTGTFLNVNTGSKPHASVAGLYPVVGWKIKSEVVYVAEGCFNDTGTVINWAKSIGLFDDPKDTSTIAYSVPNSGGVFFIPAFSGIQAPVNDAKAATGFLGIRTSTRKEHMVRAVLESIAFRIRELYDALLQEADFDFSQKAIRVDGGVSQNNFILQTIADLTNKEVERPVSTEVSILGAAFLAGIASGVWKSRQDVQALYKIEHVFVPRLENWQEYHTAVTSWSKAVKRFIRWYSEKDSIN